LSVCRLATTRRRERQVITIPCSDTAFTHFVGVDWAKDHHDIVVLDGLGQVVESFQIPHSAAGWRQLRD
jgi:hypothetical protein